MNHLYIVSYRDRINYSEFKVGITSDPSPKNLSQRYNTYGDCIIIAFLSLANLNMAHYERLIKDSLIEVRMIHGGKMVSEWVHMRYESLVLVIKAIVTLNMVIKIDPEHFIVETPITSELAIDRRYSEVPQKFRRVITVPTLFSDFEPDITDICQLLIPPSRMEIIDINRMFPKRDVFSMLNYFIDYKSSNSLPNYATNNMSMLVIRSHPVLTSHSSSTLTKRSPSSTSVRERIPRVLRTKYEPWNVQNIIDYTPSSTSVRERIPRVLQTNWNCKKYIFRSPTRYTPSSIPVSQ
jgi:hypothetical protein